MEKINNLELMNTKGGGKSFWLILGGFGLFAIGIIDGFVNPQKCKR